MLAPRGPIAGTSAAVTISGATANVTLGSAVAEGEAVTVSYAKPASQPLQRQDAGPEVRDFSDQPVFNGTGDTTPPSLVSAAVNADTLVMTFNERLDESSVPPASAFYHSVPGGQRRASRRRFHRGPRRDRGAEPESRCPPTTRR